MYFPNTVQFCRKQIMKAFVTTHSYVYMYATLSMYALTTPIPIHIHIHNYVMLFEYKT